MQYTQIQTQNRGSGAPWHVTMKTHATNRKCNFPPVTTAQPEYDSVSFRTTQLVNCATSLTTPRTVVSDVLLGVYSTCWENAACIPSCDFGYNFVLGDLLRLQFNVHSYDEMSYIWMEY